MTELETSLENEKKRYKVAFDVVREKTRQIKERRKASLKEIKARVKASKTLLDEVASLKRALHDTLH